MSTQDLPASSLESSPSSDFSGNRYEIEKNGAQRVIHDENNKFAPGNCANPLGRPKTRAITEAYKAIFERDGAEKYAAVVATDALEAKRASDRLAAIQEMTDRTEGKATQNIRHAGVFLVAAPGAETMAALDDWAGDE